MSKKLSLELVEEVVGFGQLAESLHGRKYESRVEGIIRSKLSNVDLRKHTRRPVEQQYGDVSRRKGGRRGWCGYDIAGLLDAL
jgi:hypothetical protein